MKGKKLLALVVILLLTPMVSAYNEPFNDDAPGENPDEDWYTYSVSDAGNAGATQRISEVSNLMNHTGNNSFLFAYENQFDDESYQVKFLTNQTGWANFTMWAYLNASNVRFRVKFGTSGDDTRIIMDLMKEGHSNLSFRQNNSVWQDFNIELPTETWLCVNMTFTSDGVGGEQDKFNVNVWNGSSWQDRDVWFNEEGNLTTFYLDGDKRDEYMAAGFVDDIYINETYVILGEPYGGPTNSLPNPNNGATGVSVNLNQYNVTVNDATGDTMDVYLYSNHTLDGSWYNWKSISDTTNGTVAWIGSHDGFGNFLGMGSGDLNYSTKYWWSVNTTDGTDWDNDTYYFTTGPAPPSPSITIDKVANVSTVGAGNTSVLVNYTIWVNNTGNVDFHYVLINDTKFNCSCHDFYEESGNWSTNATEETNFSIAHESCYRVFNYSGWLNESETLKFWYSKRIFNCSDVEYGHANNTAVVTTLGVATDTDYWDIVWGDIPVPPTPEEQELVDVVIPMLWILTILMIVTGLVEMFKRF